MGYYSEVGLVLSRNGVEKLHNKLKPNNITEKTRKYVEILLQCTDEHTIDNKGDESWYWDGIKWYEDDPEHFPEVNFLCEFMNEIDEHDYLFIRIGEEDTDIERRGLYFDNQFNMHLQRRIEFAEKIGIFN